MLLTNGFHTVVPGATPYVTWQIENPDRSPTVYNRLRITETRGTSSNVSEYVWDEALHTCVNRRPRMAHLRP